MKNQHQPVAVEGYPFIGLFAFVALFCAAIGWYCLATIGLGLTAFTQPGPFPAGKREGNRCAGGW